MGPRRQVSPGRTAAHPESGSSPWPSRLLGRWWSSRTVRTGDAARYNACREPFAPFLGSGLLARFEVLLQGDEEALGLGDHLEPVLPKPSADYPRRPPSENRRTVEAGVEGSNLCLALAERRKPVTHAGAVGVAIEHQIVLDRKSTR